MLKFSGFVVLSKVCVLNGRTFPSSAFCRGYALKRMLDFLHQIYLIVSCLSSFKKCEKYSF